MFEFELLEKDVELDDNEGFFYDGVDYKLSDFTRVHNNPYFALLYGDMFPDYIHGKQDDGSHQSYTIPLYIEVCEGSNTVNIYKEVM